MKLKVFLCLCGLTIVSSIVQAMPIPFNLNVQAPTDKSAFSTKWMSFGEKVADLTQRIVSKGHITDVGQAQMQIHFPKDWTPTDKRAALLVFPGGGYSCQAIDKESVKVAEWAAGLGMIGVAVKYRVSEKHDELGQFPGPLLDARLAVRLIRQNASKLGVDASKIGVAGFSAGGHLAGMSATLSHVTFAHESKDLGNSAAHRPNFALLIYPVISMDDGVTHIGTRNKILGRNPSEKLKKTCSVEKQVSSECPRIFLVHAKNDPISCKNSLLMEAACKKANVPVELHLYPNGGHGYGMEKRGAATDAWPQAAEKWLKKNKIVF